MKLKTMLLANPPLYSTWSMLGSVPLVGQLCQSEFDAIVVDMQHGTHSDDTMIAAAQTIIGFDKIAITRIPVGAFDVASRAVDVGYEAVIAPMINSKEDAQAFAASVKYPPIGQRSWGAGCAMQLHGEQDPLNYLKTANEKVLAFAMIETREAFDALDDIISVEGIDGVFVGPSDLSISLTHGETVNTDLPQMQNILATITERVTAQGKISAIFATTPQAAIQYRDMGYQYINIATDMNVVKLGTDTLHAPMSADLT